MAEYNIKGMYEPGDLEEVVGEVIVTKPKILSIIPYPFTTGIGLGLIIATVGGTMIYSIDMLKNYLR